MRGRRRATSDAAIANYDATVAAYRQTTLTAFQQVEDNLAALRILEQEDATTTAGRGLGPGIAAAVTIGTGAGWTRTCKSSPPKLLR